MLSCKGSEQRKCEGSSGQFPLQCVGQSNPCDFASMYLSDNYFWCVLPTNTLRVGPEGTSLLLSSIPPLLCRILSYLFFINCLINVYLLTTYPKHQHRLQSRFLQLFFDRTVSLRIKITKLSDD